MSIKSARRTFEKLSDLSIGTPVEIVYRDCASTHKKAYFQGVRDYEKALRLYYSTEVQGAQVSDGSLCSEPLFNLAFLLASGVKINLHAIRQSNHYRDASIMQKAFQRSAEQEQR